MPALLPVPGVARIVFRGTASGVAIVNVFHVRCGADAIAEANLITILTGVRTWYQSSILTRTSSLYSGDSATIQDLTSITGAFASQALGGTGSGSSTTVPNSTACAVTWRIARHYRGGHPRTYVGPLNSAAIENPTSLTATFIASMQAGAEAFLANVNAISTPDGPVSLVCVHRQYNKNELNPPQTSTITGVSVDSRIDTQRRRLGADR